MPTEPGADMRRRYFLGALGGVVAAWPVVSQAQRAMPVIGFLNPTSPDMNADRLRAFRQGLKETGYIENENVAVQYRWADNHIDRLPELAVELVRQQVTVIVAIVGSPPAFAAKAATTSIPTVFAVGEDPVKLGLVASLARPGRNMTGLNFLNAELTAKRFELLREMLPKASRVGVLVNPINGTNAEATLRDVTVAARAIGLRIEVLNASTISEINAAFAATARERLDALFVGGDTFFNSRRVQLANLAARHAISTSFVGRQYAEAGGLMSYGTNIADAYRQVGVYAGNILKGAKPADMPVVQATKFELVINAQTANMLGVIVPPTLLARADEVIE